MNRREKFLLFTYLGGIARDLRTKKNETEQIILTAARVPERQIPPNEFNAAQVFLAYVDGRAKPYKWMMPKITIARQPQKMAEVESRFSDSTEKKGRNQSHSGTKTGEYEC